MQPFTLLFVCAALTAAVPASAMGAPLIPSYIAAAVADPDRPQSEKARDVIRQPGVVLAFAGVKPGDRVVDLMPGFGYFTRILSKIVGPKGKVYALLIFGQDVFVDMQNSARSLAGAPDYLNVTVLEQPVTAIALPERVDMVWLSQNYHDLHRDFLGSPDMARFNRSILQALKPGGIFLVLDYVAADGTAFSKADSLHRVEPAALKMEVTAAGFEFIGQSAVLRNPLDDHSLSIFDPKISGKIDQFVYKFRKPAYPATTTPGR